MEAILELIKFHKDLGFEFELTCFLLLDISVGFFISLDCAFKNDGGQEKNRS